MKALSLVHLLWVLSVPSIAAETFPVKAFEPLLKDRFTADPSAHVFNDRIYIYASHDQSGKCPYDDIVACFDMKDYFVMSLNEDLSEVTVYDTALKVEDIPWATKQLWAPDAAYANGKYYLYFPARAEHGEFEIGVAVGDRPEGPFKAEATSIKGSLSIDPGVFKDDDGSFYMYYGGIGGGGLQNFSGPSAEALAKIPPEKRVAVAPKIAKLKSNMLEFAEEPRDVLILDENGEPMLANDLPKRFFEAAWVHKYQGKYYLSYSTGETHYLVYAIGDNPYGPFTYAGRILEPVVGWTTHHSIVKYKEQWYLFYHDSQLSGGVTFQRTVKFAPLEYDEKGKIITITPP